MDPYLEQPGLWALFHSRLIVALADAIEVVLKPEYYVEVESRTYLSETEGGLLIGISDAVVAAAPAKPAPSAEAHNSARVATQVCPQRVRLPMPEEITERYLEIREVRTGDVITAIEVLSPKNKQPGKGRLVYEETRAQVLSSLTNLVEIDLLRRGKPLTLLDGTNQQDYCILVSASDQRPTADLYSFTIRQPLPDIPIPLRSGDKPIVVPLQTIVAGVYERGRYHTRIDYTQPPSPPSLSEADQTWLRKLLREQANS
ncbi:DUF4058 family protein [Nodosilinea sp. PGN35]|uniref:DUF4058 family protein n=1 Tax=Nodosilinea sp. PGN35 TaxID=3020489 RepID=UPI0023B24905|nr:DUF4058 family protein [Nodosilinea sp. TSF1-S3]MDF0365085.1 DUF4058 family protein [Nodosilinea sp. TSF1-S3]